MAAVDRYGNTTYSVSQIEAFFDRIFLPQHHRKNAIFQSAEMTRRAEGLQFLAILQKYTLASIPFENLELHYSAHHVISIDPHAVFRKIVERGGGRGGYCMENNCLFGTVLRTLGYDVYPTGARVNEAVQPIAASNTWEGPRFDGWNHMINLVTICNQKYLVDVGFGPSGPHHPIPLIEHYNSPNIGAQSLRLTFEAPRDLITTSRPGPQCAADQQLWLYQYRHTDVSDWLPCYTFAETEFTPRDFAVTNYFTSTSRTSWFTYTVVCAKMLMGVGEKLRGDVILVGGEVKRRVGAESKLLAVLESEEQRVRALVEYLGITLSVDEQDGIRGMVTQLK